MPTKETIFKKYDEVLEHIKTVNIKTFPGHKEPLFLISDTYPGVWLEHVYDSVLWAQLCPEMAYTARAAVELFLDEQNLEGQFPCYVLDSSNPRSKAFGQTAGYGQLQECVSFARLCYETAQLNRDPALMQRSYDACIRWNTWLKRYRMTQGKGLIELFCLFDTGHDNSIRLSGVPNDTPGADARVCNEKPDLLPLFAPDLNAVYYDTLTALGDMAKALNKPEEASRWYADANYLRITLDTVCYDPEDGFYYDADRFGNRRKCKSISITNLYAAHMLPKERADRIFDRYLHSPKEFWTPYPFSSLSTSDPLFKKRGGSNDWGYYAMGLTAERSLRWMDFYGYGNALEEEMEAWVNAVADSDTPFGQDMDPFTGKFTGCAPWYSATMLFYVAAVRRLYLK